jgi:DNA-binding transcriptional ArsR family regulator
MLGSGAMALEPVLPAARFDISSFGELVSDPSRVAILLALMDGSTRPATELADIAGVTRSTASAHLRRLIEGRLIVVDVRGRHRYFRLAGDEVADALEAVALIRPLETRARSPARLALAEARTCYHHLAGRLGVAWLAALEDRRLVAVCEGALALSPAGARFFEGVGLSPASPRWPTGKPCLDWTERRYHLGGRLGAVLTEQLFAMKWIARKGDGRVVRVTAKGSTELARQLGVRTA